MCRSCIANFYPEHNYKFPASAHHRITGYSRQLMKLIRPRPLSQTITNHYKRHDIFRCTHQSHTHFGYRVSVFHVLKEKECFPKGCIYFNWRCRLLNKGQTCPKKFKHVGRNCFNCREFYDEKELLKPELLVGEKDYALFLKNLQRFEDWLNTVRGREIDFSGTIHCLKPSFYKKAESPERQISFDGFLLNFSSGYVNLDYFDDPVYAKIGSAVQHRLKLGTGDKVNFRAHIKEVRGRIVLLRVRGIDIDEKAAEEIWTESRAQLAKSTGTIIPGHHERCLRCDRGSLLDIVSDEKKQRMMLCLEGIQDPDYCIYSVSKLLLADRCARVEREQVSEVRSQKSVRHKR